MKQIGDGKRAGDNSTWKEALFSFPAYLVCFLLLVPFLVFCFQLDSPAWPEGGSFIYVFLMTLVQSGSSTLLSLFLGLLGCQGLLSLVKRKCYFLIEGLVLFPALIPPLLLVLSVVQIVEKVMAFPFGLPALIFAQTLTYTGLCAVVFTRILLKEAHSLSEWAYLQGSSAGLFLKALLKTVLLKDTQTLFVLVFASSFTSLSLPLLVSGSPFFSLEFFIYEKLKEPKLWAQALSLIVFQSLFIFLICWKAFSGYSSSDLKMSLRRIYLLPHPLFLFIPFGALIFSLGGLFLISNLEVFSQVLSLASLVWSSVLNSLILSLGVGFFILLFLIFMSLSFQNLKARRFVVSFMPPGVSFMGFAFLLWPFYGKGFILMKWVLGLSFLLFPFIYRFRGERTLERLSSQVETARFLGAGWWLIFRKILWPQSYNAFFLCAGIAGFWACGDFAYSLIVSSGHWNLSLLVYDLFSSYRLEEAVLLSWLLLGLSFFVFLFWRGAAFVFDKKSVL